VAVATLVTPRLKLLAQVATVAAGEALRGQVKQLAERQTRAVAVAVLTDMSLEVSISRQALARQAQAAPAS
jgi:hypothetical protein